ncbi:MAG: hypothetical protein ACTHOG_12205 [Marmoricola sp.]
MSILTTHAPRVTKTTHTASIAAGLVALPLALLLAAAYGSAMMHGFAQLARGAFSAVGAGASHTSDVPISVAFAAVLAIVVVAIALAVREYFADEDKEIHDVR